MVFYLENHSLQWIKNMIYTFAVFKPNFTKSMSLSNKKIITLAILGTNSNSFNFNNHSGLLNSLRISPNLKCTLFKENSRVQLNQTILNTRFKNREICSYKTGSLSWFFKLDAVRSLLRVLSTMTLLHFIVFRLFLSL